MALKISFFSTPKHRVFHYEPLYYDENKERRELLLQDIEREKAIKEGRVFENDKYRPGQHLRGKLRNSSDDHKRHAMKSSTKKIITLVTLVVLFVLIYYFAQYYSWILYSL